MCVKKIAEENVVDGIDMYMKKYAITDDIVDINALNERLNDIDEDYYLVLEIVYRRMLYTRSRVILEKIRENKDSKISEIIKDIILIDGAIVDNDTNYKEKNIFLLEKKYKEKVR